MPSDIILEIETKLKLEKKTPVAGNFFEEERKL